MSDAQKRMWPERHLDFESFPENLELANNIEARVQGNPKLDAYRGGQIKRSVMILNTLAIERYIVQLYHDVKFKSMESAINACNGIASEAFLISLAGAPGYYSYPEDRGEHPVGHDVVTFVKKMGDSIAMSEVDLDLGTNRWTQSMDLLMDMLSSLNTVSTSIMAEPEVKSDNNGADTLNMEYNVITGTTLIAAYAMIIYQCIKNGSYRGQTLKDIHTK